MAARAKKKLHRRDHFSGDKIGESVGGKRKEAEEKGGGSKEVRGKKRGEGEERRPKRGEKEERKTEKRDGKSSVFASPKENFFIYLSK